MCYDPETTDPGSAKLTTETESQSLHPTLVLEFQTSLDLVLAFRNFFASSISEKSEHDKALKKLATAFYQAYPWLVRKFPKKIPKNPIET